MSKIALEKTVEVTDKHINQGKRKDCSNCPIALAIKEVLPEYDKVSVTYGKIYVSHGELKLESPLNPRAMWFIDGFDEGLTVVPFSFNLRLRKVS